MVTRSEYTTLCYTCKGFGIDRIPMGGTPVGPRCPSCGGSGSVYTDNFTFEVSCQRCNGKGRTGFLNLKKCPHCRKGLTQVNVGIGDPAPSNYQALELQARTKPITQT